MIRIVKRISASELPKEWDACTQSYFQQREFLSYAESWNPCKQRYYWLMEDNVFRAGAIVYTLTLNLLTFLHIPSPVAMHVIGVPIGTATAGYFGEIPYRQSLLTRILEIEHGLILTLNANTTDNLPVGVKCRMVPTTIFHNPFKSWSEYTCTMRALHRRRLFQIERCAEKLIRVLTDCSSFTEKHYQLYRQVHDRAPAKLETLTYDFFLHLPKRFKLASYYQGEVLVSWTITVHDGMYFMYFFGGMDYAKLKETKSYFVGLAYIVRDCIEQGHPMLDLGQTADEPKLRFGGRLERKDMYLTHHQIVVRTLLKWFRSFIEYRGQELSFDVLKNSRTSV